MALRAAFALWLCALSLSLGGCASVSSFSELAPPEQRQMDEALLGAWWGESLEGEPQLAVSVNSGEDGQYEVHIVDQDEDSYWLATLTRIGSAEFIGLKSGLGQPGREYDCQSLAYCPTYILRLHRHGEVLTLDLLEPDWLTGQAPQSQLAIAHWVEKSPGVFNPVRNYVITADVPELRAWLERISTVPEAWRPLLALRRASEDASDR